jgi:hypothetical protein
MNLFVSTVDSYVPSACRHAQPPQSTGAEPLHVVVPVGTVQFTPNRTAFSSVLLEVTT